MFINVESTPFEGDDNTPIRNLSEWADHAVRFKDITREDISLVIELENYEEAWMSELWDAAAAEDYDDVKSFFQLISKVADDTDKQAVAYWLMEDKGNSLEQTLITIDDAEISTEDRAGSAMEWFNDKHGDVGEPVENHINFDGLCVELANNGVFAFIQWYDGEVILMNADAL